MQSFLVPPLPPPFRRSLLPQVSSIYTPVYMTARDQRVTPDRPINGALSSNSEADLTSTADVTAPSFTAKTGTVIFMAICNEFAMASLYRRLLRHYATERIHASAHGSILRLACDGSDAFVFPYGCLVVWGPDDASDDFLEIVAEDAIELRAAPAVDSMRWGSGDIPSLSKDFITLTTGATDLEPAMERMAISCALAQSIKLGAFENSMRATIEGTRHLPEELAETGEITASRREVSRLMGKLFLSRYRYHLSGDLLMTPAFFWDNEQYLPWYRKIERYLEIRERGEVLNKRVEVVQELYKLLGDELTHQNSMALELAITIMIAFEIVLTLLTIAKESMRSMFSACAMFIGLSVCAWLLWWRYRKRREAIAVNKFPKSQEPFS